jgi:hypothetical protein
MDDLKLVAVLGNGRRHALRLAPELEPRRALEYLAGASGARAHYPALDREWIETEEGLWIRRSAIVELELISGTTSGTRSESASLA